MKNQWYINNSSLSISLLHYYVCIDIICNDNNVVYNLTVINEEREKTNYKFESLESAITFTEEVVNYCDSFDEMTKSYLNSNYSKQLSLFKDW